MGKILLDYVFPISVIESIPQASTAFLKQVAVVAKPKSGQEGNVGQLFECTNMTQVAARTDNVEAQQLFNAGMSKVFILLATDLDLEAYLETHKNKFFTLLISSDFADEDVGITEGSAAVAASLVKGDLTFTAKVPGLAGNDLSIEFLDSVDAGEESATKTGDKITVLIEGGVSTATQIKAAIDDSVSASEAISVAIAPGEGSTAQAAFTEDDLENGANATATGLLLGTYDGVVGVASADADFAQEQGAIGKRSAWFKKESNGAKNMFFAFGKLLSNLTNWRNQQYIEMPFNDDVDELGEANSLFDDKVSFVINDEEFGNRLALFAAGGKAIVAPYILKNLRIDMQSRALQWIALNQPQYTVKEATLLEARVQEDVINAYVTRQWIESGNIEITLQEQNFVASGEIEVPTPKALWRVANEMTETT